VTADKHRNGAGGRWPALFPFITLRQERSGALLFNPFMAVEEELDPLGALVAGMCDGTRTVEGILGACRASGLSTREARRRFDETVAVLNRAGALQFVARRARGRPRPAPSIPEGSDAALSAPKSVVWDVTYACNLACPHCLTSSGVRAAAELDTAGALALVDALAEARVLYLSLTGGEPFMRKDIIRILGHIAETGMRVDIATNGFSLPPSIIRALRRLPVFQVQVSIDGIGRTHDEFRGRDHAFANSCATLRRLKDEGISTSISTTATARNIGQLGEIIDLAVELGCDGYKAIPFIPAGRGKSSARSLELGKRGSLRLCRALTDASRRLAGTINVSTDPTYTFLLEPPAAPAEQDGMMVCSAGYDTLSVGADGTAYPCPFLHDFPLGNVLEKSVFELWHGSAVLHDLRTLEKDAMTGPCRTCEYAPGQCRGGCRASAWLDCGSLRGSDPLCFKALLRTGRGPKGRASGRTPPRRRARA